MQPFRVQLADLTLMQLTNWRWSWRGTLIFSTIAPLVTTLAFGVFASDNGVDFLGYVLTGNVVLSLIFSAVGRVSGHYAFMRAMGRLDHFATLPIYRSALTLATVLAFLLLALPSALVTLFAGALLLNVPLNLHPAVLLVIPLTGISLSGLGAVIGVVGRTQEEVGTLSNLATLLLFGFGPVVLPLERLPDVINTLSLLSPATYAASALRQTVLGWPDRIPLAVDIAVLCVVTVGLLWLVEQHMDWRQR